MVAVIVREHQVIDLGDARLLRDGDDAVRIARARPAGIDQQRLSGRRDEQSGLPALDVNEINVQVLARVAPRRGRMTRPPLRENQKTAAHLRIGSPNLRPVDTVEFSKHCVPARLHAGAGFKS